eukprot:gb/GEZJ01008059.1/.p1 GENE.gb/GEZJ01008059.1/~~gb/GEZJ01008059.1/.p1  ORF type:complete len:215 (-),score=32.24 gb/GEZJ01008059.1/:200-844(-)
MKLFVMNLVIFCTLLGFVSAVHVDGDLFDSSEHISNSFSVFERTTEGRSARGWQTFSLERSKNQLQILETEMDRVREAYQCQKKKDSILRILYWREKHSMCRISEWRAARDCNKKWGIKKNLRNGKNMCNWDKKCMAKHVWPLQRMLQKAEAACKCIGGSIFADEIRKANGIKCPKTRNGWDVKSEIRKLQMKIDYLENVLAKRSAAPRLRWKN